jgi:signal transduction histidine kinase
LSDVIVRVFETVSVPEEVKLSIIVKDSEKIRIDPTLLQRVISNLVNNAIQAMLEGGKLEICGKRADSRILITVSDTGVGIPKEVKTKLFTPMMTTKAKGQGFGLAVSKRLIEAMKGTISFESEEGKGTKFIIDLPVKN